MSKDFTGNHETDASVWAKGSCKRDLQTDEGLTLGMFARAIKAGHDVATSEYTYEIDRLKSEKAELLEALEAVLKDHEQYELMLDLPRWTMDKALSAIKKARGEE